MLVCVAFSVEDKFVINITATIHLYFLLTEVLCLMLVTFVSQYNQLTVLIIVLNKSDL